MRRIRLFIANSSLNDFWGCIFKSNLTQLCLAGGSSMENETPSYDSLFSCWLENKNERTNESADVLLHGSKLCRATGAVESRIFGVNSAGHPARGANVNNEYVEGTRIVNNVSHAKCEVPIDTKRPKTICATHTLTGAKGKVPPSYRIIRDQIDETAF